MTISSRINKVKTPDSWIEEGVKSPFTKVKEKTEELCDYIKKKYSIKPRVIASTVENGMFLSYKTKKYEIIIEIYNDDLSIGACVCCNKEIIKSCDFQEIKSISILENFFRA